MTIINTKHVSIVSLTSCICFRPLRLHLCGEGQSCWFLESFEPQSEACSSRRQTLLPPPQPLSLWGAGGSLSSPVCLALVAVPGSLPGLSMHVIRALCGGLEWGAEGLGQGAHRRVIRVHPASKLLDPGTVEADGGFSGAPL